MAMEQFAEQFETRYAEKMSDEIGSLFTRKNISYERQHYEVVDAYEGTRAIVKILWDTLNHIEEEKKLNLTEAEKEE
ncbi:12628_t:CDS:2, partial [Racocetra persica]